MRKRFSNDRGLSRPAHADVRPVAFEVALKFEPLESRRLLAGVPVLLAEINPGGASNPAEFVSTGSDIFFSSDNGANGRELWKTDGSMGGTLMVKDIAPLAASSSPAGLTNVNGTLFFTADDGTNGVELWKSDGTPGGTMLVKNINPLGGSDPGQLTNVDGTLFFAANDGTNGVELWKSDGTELGTTMVMDIHPGGDSDPRYLTAVGGELFFSADNGLNGPELWKSDSGGTSTVMVKDINAGGSGSYPGYFDSMVDVDGILFFSAFDAASGFELWKSDGTTLGTTLVRDVNAGAGSSFPFVMSNVDGTLFFTADDGSSGFELWKSDGTFGGTTLIKDINPAVGVGSVPDGLANVNGTLFFRADNGTNGVELWKSDGTFGGTEMVLDINTSGSSTPRYLTNVSGTLFFRADEGVSLGLTGTELWRSDGTPGGTTLAVDIAPGQDSSNPQYLANAAGALLFSAEIVSGNREPWILPAAPATVVATRLFYNQSGFDGQQVAANALDDSAIASDKTAYLPGTGPASFASVSSYDKGINGVMIDLSGAHGALSADDFTLRAGSSNTPANWPLAPAPLSVTVRDEAGEGGSDRIELIWANGAIKQTWLQVTVNANSNTNLAVPYTFLFGNAVADSGMGNPPTAAVTDSVDEIFARNSAGIATVTNLADYNRDAFVDAGDAILARNNPDFLALLNVSAPPSIILDRYLFYNESYFDNNDPGANSDDDLAVATDKVAYLPGAGLATFANISSYSRGINGIMFDVSGSHPGITAADFTFRVGTSNAPSTWSAAPAPVSVSVRSGEGVGGTDRVTLIWANGAIANTWLEVTVDANANTGLANPDIFYFASRVGDTGSDNDPIVAITDSTDVIETRNHQGIVYSVTDVYDFDRDSIITASDEIYALNNFGFTAKIEVTNPPGPPTDEFLASEADADGYASLDAVALALSTRVESSASVASELDPRVDQVARVGRRYHDVDKSPPVVSTSGLVRQLRQVEVDQLAEALALDEELLDALVARLLP